MDTYDRKQALYDHYEPELRQYHCDHRAEGRLSDNMTLAFDEWWGEVDEDELDNL